MSSLERYTGRVKWFNNKAGYGFITVTDGPKSGTDVFVHHSCINVHSEQYKYLVQGEYIEFNLSDTKTDNHQFQAGEVSGIKGGKLMCETRCETKSSRNQYNINELEVTNLKSSPPLESVRMPKSVSAPKYNKQTTQRGHNEADEWSYVAKDTNSSAGRGSGRGRGRGSGSGSGRGSGSGSGRGSGREEGGGRL